MDREHLTATDGFAFEAVRIPAEHARKGGLILLQEIFGVNSHMIEAGRRFAAEGYEVLIPALYDREQKGFVREGHDAEAIEAGRSLAQAIGLGPVMMDVAACIDALEAPVFITGFCYGGSMAYFAACRLEGLSAAACYYGSLIPDAADQEPQCPTIAHFGRADSFIPMEGVETFKALRSDVETYVYEAGHGFARQRSEDYDAAADALAMTRTLGLFDQAMQR